MIRAALPAALRSLASTARRRLAPTAAATTPAVLRLAVGAYHLRHVGRRRSLYRGVHRTDAASFDPVGPARILRRPLPPRVADALLDASLVTGALFTAGIAHRVTGPLHAALQTWNFSYRNSWSMVYHHENTLVLHTMVLGAAPSADALSVDALRRDGTLLPARRSWMYGATPTVMNAAVSLTYLIAGLAKLSGGDGARWIEGGTMRGHIAFDALRKEMLGEQGSPLARALYPYKHLFTAMATVSLVLELGAPLAVLDRRLGRLFALGAFGMHWGIKGIMRITFPYNLSGVLYLPFVLMPPPDPPQR
ncbi:hypothetical protein [Brachybacterium sp. YJGR34]|uniref:hypothetical protein n=1 Tax=Brachybacterium sp. YJGR34 TaxID=2059911 RepID=UPI001E4F6C07|nr:hypothetical protein [Brachybacterium sp. YJGR34]